MLFLLAPTVAVRDFVPITYSCTMVDDNVFTSALMADFITRMVCRLGVVVFDTFLETDLVFLFALALFIALIS